MILTGPAIRAALYDGRITCSLPEPDPRIGDPHVGPNSLDLHLGPQLRVYRRSWLDKLMRWPLDPLRGLPPLEDVPLEPGRYWVLRPGQLYLGVTAEWVGTMPGSGLVPYLDGRSSLARLGVMAHLAAGRGDVGFRGRWTVELVAHEPVRLRPGDRLFQMTFMETTGTPEAYVGEYAGRTAPVASKLGPR